MRVRNQHPAQLAVQHLDPRSTAATPAGGVRVEWANAYTSLFLGGANGDTSFVMDGEIWRTSVATRAGLGGGFDLELELPVAHGSGGFLDDFVIAWHDFFGFPDQGRDRAENDQFLVEAVDRGQFVWGMQERDLELLDVPLALNWSAFAPTDARPFGLLLRAGLELPTGNDDRGFGSGGVDASLGVVGEWRLPRLALYGHLQHSFAETPSATRRRGFTFEDVTSAGLSAEWAFAEDVSAVGQIEWETSTLRNLDLDRAANDQWLLWTGVRYHFADRWRVDASIGEDLRGFIAPDFTAWLTVGVDLGPRAGD